MLIAGRKPVYRGPRLENATGNIHTKGETESRELKNAANPFGPERCNYEFPHLVKEQNASRAEDNGRKIHWIVHACEESNPKTKFVGIFWNDTANGSDQIWQVPWEYAKGKNDCWKIKKMISM